MKYVGDTANLGRKGYDVDSSFEYFFKKVKNKKTNTELTCYVNLYTRKVSFVGDERNKPFFLKELEGDLKEE